MIIDAYFMRLVNMEWRESAKLTEQICHLKVEQDLLRLK